MLRAFLWIFVIGIILAIIGLMGLIIIPAIIATFGIIAGIIAGVIVFLAVIFFFILFL